MRDHKVNLKGQEVLPLEAGIHFAGCKADNPRVAPLNPPKKKKVKSDKGTPEAISNTPEVVTLTTGSDGTPLKKLDAGPTPLSGPL